uniref:5'-nucleotidase domain-containing protein 1 n=1 Tax=Culicoides sonorensis TaxID=179676 RepID=A0A336LIQ4_CULSO
MMANSDVFRLSDYDCIGFDLDNTLVQYKIAEMVQLEYQMLVKYLIENKNYPAECLQKPLDMDFMQKGLILDFAKGNLLKLNAGGTIAKATHGTKFLTDDEIVKYYGPDKRWEVTDEYCSNFLATWNGPLAEKMRTLLDYFDMSVSLVFGRMVDYIDEVRSTGQKCEFELWPDILSGLRTMYDRENFRLDKGDYFPEMKQNPDKYIHKASPALLNWLQEVSQKKTTFLITGSHIDFANLTATHALGPDWRRYFNFIGVFAKKPGFFCGAKPFVKLDGVMETLALKPEELKLGEIYSQGNWRDMMPLLAQHTGAKNPKFLYFGDNLIQDIYSPAKFTKCDSIVVVEEMLGEGMKCIDELHQDCVLLKSHTWGSFFSHDGKPSLWAELIEKYSKICIPSVETLAKYPFDHEFQTFTENEHSKGFYPEDPLKILPTIQKQLQGLVSEKSKTKRKKKSAKVRRAEKNQKATIAELTGSTSKE